MNRRPYGTFKLGRRGRRGRQRFDGRWTQNASWSTLRRRHSNNSHIAVEQEIRAENERQWSLSDWSNEFNIESTPVDNTETYAPFSLYDDEDETVLFAGGEDDLNPSGDEGTEFMTSTGASTDEVRFVYETRDEIRSAWIKLCRWENILAFMLLNGTGRLSFEQYDVIISLLNMFMRTSQENGPSFPALSTVRRSIVPILQRWSFVSSNLRTAVVDVSKSGAPRVSHSRDDGRNNVCFFGIACPSAWSEMDVSCKQTWDILKGAACNTTDLDEEPIFSFIESVPMVADKENILNVANAIIPTKLIHDSGISPLLLSERYSAAGISLHFKRVPSFPAIALNGMEICMNIDQHNFVIRSRSISSALLLPLEERTSENSDYDVNIREGINNARFSAWKTERSGHWKTGDVVTLLETPAHTDFVFVLVQQHLRRSGLPQKMELLCIPFEEIQMEEEIMVRMCFNMTFREEVSDITTSVTNSLPRDLPVAQSAPSFGKLQDGRLCFIDIILLYSDGFSQYNFKQGSAGGIYALSLNYPPPLRRARERVRVVGLTPPGVSTMEGLRGIIDDIVKSSTAGVAVTNADGEEMLLFTNVVGFVSDYHETGHALDVTGQNGMAPCHLCSFLRYKKKSFYGFPVCI